MTACPLCGGASEVAFVTRDRNRAVSDEPFTYRRCARCASLFLENVPPDLGRYYTDDYFELPTLDGLREQARAEAYRIDLVTPHARGGRLVEIGPGHGVFAVQAKDAGFETAGIEMDPGAVRYLREAVGIEAVESGAPEEALRAMPPSRVIALWHVLEHLPRPWEMLAAAAENLEPGGVVVVATPNPEALGFRLLDGRWPHVDAPRHLFLIAFDALRDRARALGLQVASVTATDPGGRHWNRFAWHRALARPAPGALNDLRYRAAGVAGAAIAAALGPVERRGRLGAAYTAVLVKP
jgi:2-polyprenyl-3-methyl-5-hydroxy-6-metoxy-1,4-benzoquinol methylase